MKFTKKQIMLIFVALGSLVVLYLVSYKLIPQIMVTFTKAAPATIVSVSDSYVIGEKILCKADGEDACRVNVFLLDKNGKPVVGKNVSMKGEATIESLNQLSDKDGKVSFEVSGETEGQVDLQATYQGIALGSTITVTLRNER